MVNRRAYVFPWFPRILAILFALFLSIFSLDTLSEPGETWAKMAGFLIHLIPAALVSLCLILAWRRPALGGAAFLLLGMASIFSCSSWRSPDAFLMITLPLLLSGILFIIQALLNRS